MLVKSRGSKDNHSEIFQNFLSNWLQRLGITLEVTPNYFRNYQCFTGKICFSKYLICLVMRLCSNTL